MRNELSADYQRQVGDFVGREVIYCVSTLVSEVAGKEPDDWFHLFSQDDWETPVEYHLSNLPSDELKELIEEADIDIEGRRPVSAYMEYLTEEDKIEDFAGENDLDPEQNEIYEHWIVSNWLADKLEAKGEVVEKDFYGLTIWGRACTGQAVRLDRRVICDIYDETQREAA